MVGRFSLYKSKLSELWLEHNPELHVEVYLTTARSTCSVSYMFLNELFIHINIGSFRRSISVKRPMDMKHVKIITTYTALDNTRNTLYQN
jgi:hypothetical protein